MTDAKIDYRSTSKLDHLDIALIRAHAATGMRVGLIAEIFKDRCSLATVRDVIAEKSWDPETIDVGDAPLLEAPPRPTGPQPLDEFDVACIKELAECGTERKAIALMYRERASVTRVYEIIDNLERV